MTRFAAATVAALAVVLVTACGGDDDARRPTPAEGDTPAMSPSAVPTGESSPVPTLQPTESPAIEITGLDAGPRERDVDITRSLGPRPESPFAPWNRESTVIFDLESGIEEDLGPGSIAWFSPDGSRAVWVAGVEPLFNGGDANLLNLDTGERRSLGPARFARFQDDNHVVLVAVEIENEGTDDAGYTAEVVDLRSDEREPVDLDLAFIFEPPFYNVHLPQSTEYQVDVQLSDEQPEPIGGSRVYTVRDPDTNELLVRFEANNATVAGPEHIAVATVPDGGRTNVYLVDLATGEAEFIGSAPLTTADMFPLVANTRYVAWTEDFCNPVGAAMRLYDRETGELAAIDLSAIADEHTHNMLFPAAFSQSGQLALGAFGARTLIDPDSLEYEAFLPEGFGDVSWSDDYQHASVGQFPGHGGRCG